MALHGRERSRTTGKDGRNRGNRLRTAAATVLGVIFLLAAWTSLCAVAAGQPGQTVEPPPSSQPEKTPRKEDQPGSTQPEGAPEGEQEQEPEKEPIVEIAVDMPETVVDFGGGYLEPGETYYDTVTVRVRSGSEWALRLNKENGLVGERHGQVMDAPSVSIDARSTSGENAALSVECDQGPQVGVVCRGVEDAGDWITVTIRYGLHVSWEVEPDTYRSTQDVSISPI